MDSAHHCEAPVFRFYNAFDEFRTSAFRFQVMPQYVTETTKYFEMWKRGESQPQETIATEWNEFVRDEVAKGRTMQMVHVVDTPFNEYVRYCLDWWYPHRIGAGEQVLGAKREQFADMPMDFWLFDDVTAFRMEYDDEGRLRNVVELTNAEVTDCVTARSAVLSKARPFDELGKATML